VIQIALLFSCILSGFLLRKTRFFDKGSPLALNNLIVYFFIPVITLYHVPRIAFQSNLIWLSITPFMVYIGSFLFIKTVALFQKIDKASEGALIMTSGIGSTSFVGFPIFEILYGEEGLAFGIMLSLAGTILVFNTLGVGTGMYYSQSTRNYRSFLKRLLSFPPLHAFLLALILNLMDVQLPESLTILLGKLAAPFSVLALLAIGMQIEFNLERSLLKYLLIGQAYKLFLAPFLMYLFMWQFLDIQDLIARVCIMGAAIGSMNAVSIVAAQMGLNPKLSSFMPALSIPLSIPLLFILDKLLT